MIIVLLAILVIFSIILIVKKSGCVHSWNMWEIFKDGYVVDENKTRMGVAFIQRRRCSICGITQQKIERNSVRDE